MCQLKALRDNVTSAEVAAKLEDSARPSRSRPSANRELERAARTSVALDKLVAQNDLGSMAYYYEGVNGNDYENIVTSVIAGNTLLTGRNIPVAGECEVKNAQAMKIMAEFGAGGSFSEPYAMDFEDDVVLWATMVRPTLPSPKGCRPSPPTRLPRQTGQRSLDSDDVKHGPVTLLSVVEGHDGIFLLVAEGESVPGKVLQIGNTNSRYRFSIGARAFMDAWSKPAPHTTAPSEPVIWHIK